MCVLMHISTVISINLYLTKTPVRIKLKPGKGFFVLKLQTAGGLPRCRGWERRILTRAGAKTKSLLPEKHH